MLEYISTAAMARSWESGRRSKGEVGREVAKSGSGRDGPQYAGMDTGDVRVG